MGKEVGFQIHLSPVHKATTLILSYRMNFFDFEVEVKKKKKSDTALTADIVKEDQNTHKRLEWVSLFKFEFFFCLFDLLQSNS